MTWKATEAKWNRSTRRMIGEGPVPPDPRPAKPGDPVPDDPADDPADDPPPQEIPMTPPMPDPAPDRA